MVVALIWTIKPVRPSHSSDAQVKSDLLGALRFVLHRPTVLGAIALDLFAVLFGGATALLPAFASNVLHVAPAGLGVLRTAPGVGAALIALAVGVAPIDRHVGRWMFGGVALFGAATIVGEFESGATARWFGPYARSSSAVSRPSWSSASTSSSFPGCARWTGSPPLSRNCISVQFAS